MFDMPSFVTAFSTGISAQPPSWADVDTAADKQQHHHINDVFSGMGSFTPKKQSTQDYRSIYGVNATQAACYTHNIRSVYANEFEQFSALAAESCNRKFALHSNSSSKLDRYAMVSRYRASKNELMENAYPTFTSGRSKRVTIAETTFTKGKKLYVSPEDKMRRCSRCHTEFELEHNGSRNCVYRLKGKQAWEKRRCHVYDQMLVTELDTFLPTEKPTGVNDPRSLNIFAIDAEMVYTTAGPALARLSVVNWDGQLVMDTIVKPPSMVIDPNTEFSGLTMDDINAATDSLQTCRQKFFSLVNERSILVGHSLESDLKALRITHDNVVDTSLLYLAKGFKVGLKKLALAHLGINIQANNSTMQGHDSEEDARVALNLLKLRMGMS